MTSNRELAKIQLPTLKMDVPILLVAHQAHRSSAARPGFVMCVTIVEGCRHAMRGATVGLSVAAGDKRRALEQLALAVLAIKEELLERGLQRARSSVHCGGRSVGSPKQALVQL